MKTFILSFFFFHLTATCFAWPPEVAPELNFTNKELADAWEANSASPWAEISNPVSLGIQEKFKKMVEQKCPECTITESQDKYGIRKYQVNFKNGWYFSITLDPSVIEITAKPIAIDQIQVNQKEIDDRIYDAAKQIGLKVDDAGHLNYGVASTFGNDAKLFVDFIADYLNNPGLTSGVLGYEDAANAPHPELLEEAQRAALKKIFAEFDPNTKSIAEFAQRLYKEVYYKSPTFGGTQYDPYEKYQAVNITSIAKAGDTWPRLELRAVPMQSSARDMYLMNTLFAARIKYLKSQPTRVQYIGDKTYHSATPLSMVTDFHRYVVESGLKWEDYRHLISKEKRFIQVVGRFEKKLAEGKIKVKAPDRPFTFAENAPAVPTHSPVPEGQRSNFFQRIKSSCQSLSTVFSGP